MSAECVAAGRARTHAATLDKISEGARAGPVPTAARDTLRADDGDLARTPERRPDPVDAPSGEPIRRAPGRGARHAGDRGVPAASAILLGRPLAVGIVVPTRLSRCSRMFGAGTRPACHRERSPTRIGSRPTTCVGEQRTCSGSTLGQVLLTSLAGRLRRWSGSARPVDHGRALEPIRAPRMCPSWRPDAPIVLAVRRCPVALRALRPRCAACPVLIALHGLLLPIPRRGARVPLGKTVNKGVWK